MVLILIDGLSYYDLPESDDMVPCLVPGPSITEFGFRRIIGAPTISNRLFFEGYKNQLAFSYFDLHNPLSSCLHQGFSETQFNRIREFNDIIAKLNKKCKRRMYIQIILGGLDSLCHNHHDQPPIHFYKAQMMEQLADIEEVFQKKKMKYQIHLISDHGILWKECYKDFTLVHDMFPEDRYHPRLIKGAFNRTYSKICQGVNGKVTLLKAPFINRKFRNNEWGMHGGISAWESIVPFITRIG